MTFSDWIDLKTPQTLSVVLKKKEGTIRMWKTRNSIPRDIWPEIMERFAEIGVRDLRDMESASK